MVNPITVVLVTTEFDLWLDKAAVGSWEIKVICLYVCVGLMLCVFLNVAICKVVPHRYLNIMIKYNFGDVFICSVTIVSPIGFRFPPICDTEMKR